MPVHASVAQLAEQVPCKDKVGGSIPFRGSNLFKIMAFIIIPICYVDGSFRDDGEDDNEITQIRKKNRKPHILEADMTINTKLICSYVGDDSTGHTFINMSDGNTLECLYSREEFTAILLGAEAFVDLSYIKEN